MKKKIKLESWFKQYEVELKDAEFSFYAADKNTMLRCVKDGKAMKLTVYKKGKKESGSAADGG